MNTSWNKKIDMIIFIFFYIRADGIRVYWTAERFDSRNVRKNMYL